MRIFVPFSHLRAHTYAVLKGVAEFYPLKDQTAYSRYFAERWAEGKTFINVEHDVVPTLEKLQELWSCPKPWCGCSYLLNVEDQTPYMGCVKISAEFIAAHSGIWTERPWGNCDVFMANKATLPYHWHGAVEHSHRD